MVRDAERLVITEDFVFRPTPRLVSGLPFYIRAPEECAEWVGYSVNELLNGAGETDTDTQQSATTAEAANTGGSDGFLSRLFGD